MSTLKLLQGNSCSYWQTSSYLLQDCLHNQNTGVGRFQLKMATENIPLLVVLAMTLLLVVMGMTPSLAQLVTIL